MTLHLVHSVKSGLSKESEVQFDYRIHKGKGGETNAVALLKIFGFPRDVVEQANMRLEEVAL